MNHSGMTGSVIVMEQREFDDWLSGNTGSTTPATAGQQLFQTLGCASCHGPNGEGGRGPNLNSIFGKNQQLQSGQTVRVDEGYIRESITDPQAKLVAGFGPIMPTFQGQVSEDQIVQLIAYIKYLHGTGETTPTVAGIPAPSARPGASPTRNIR
jgi:cytochrome c oxidase subunit 2